MRLSVEVQIPFLTSHVPSVCSFLGDKGLPLCPFHLVLTSSTFCLLLNFQRRELETKCPKILISFRGQRNYHWGWLHLSLRNFQSTFAFKSLGFGSLGACEECSMLGHEFQRFDQHGSVIFTDKLWPGSRYNLGLSHCTCRPVQSVGRHQET